MINKGVIIQFIKFGLVGAICLSIDMIITAVLKEYIGVNKYIANATGFAISSTINFYLHKIWTFGSSNKALKEYYIFIMIATIGLILNSFILYLFTDVIQLDFAQFLPVEDKVLYNFYLAKLVTVVIVFFWNFGMNRRFTFKGTTAVQV